MQVYKHLVRSAVCISQLNILLSFHPVEVFMKTVKQEGQKFLRIVLLVTQEL